MALASLRNATYHHRVVTHNRVALRTSGKLHHQLTQLALRKSFFVRFSHDRLIQFIQSPSKFFLQGHALSKLCYEVFPWNLVHTTRLLRSLCHSHYTTSCHMSGILVIMWFTLCDRAAIGGSHTMRLFGQTMFEEAPDTSKRLLLKLHQVFHNLPGFRQFEGLLYSCWNAATRQNYCVQ